MSWTTTGQRPVSGLSLSSLSCLPSTWIWSSDCQRTTLLNVAVCFCYHKDESWNQCKRPDRGPFFQHLQRIMAFTDAGSIRSSGLSTLNTDSRKTEVWPTIHQPADVNLHLQPWPPWNPDQLTGTKDDV